MPIWCEAGAGPTVVAMHPADDFGPATAERLARVGARVICVDPTSRTQPLEAMVDELEALRREEAWGRLSFWGLSGGGFLGLLYALRHPSALTSLVLESTCACFHHRLDDPDCIASPRHPHWKDDTFTGFVDGWSALPAGGEVYVDQGQARLASPAALSEGMRAAMPAMLAYDVRAQLGAITVPALVIQGSADPMVPTRHGRALVDGLPGGTWLEIQGAGHVPSAAGHPAAIDAVGRFLMASSDGAT